MAFCVTEANGKLNACVGSLTCVYVSDSGNLVAGLAYSGMHTGKFWGEGGDETLLKWRWDAPPPTPPPTCGSEHYYIVEIVAFIQMYQGLTLLTWN